MEIIKLKTLDLEVFNKDNIEHMTFLKSLIKDKTITSRFQGLTNGLLHNHGDKFFDRGFFVSSNDVLIGYIKIGDYAFSNYEMVESIRLKIAYDNKQSLKTASSCGYKWLRDDFYIIYNPYLNKSKRTL